MTNSVHINAPAGVIDIEGEKDFVEGLLAKLFPLIENAGFGSRPQGQEPEAIIGPDSAEEGASVETETVKTRTRKVSKKPPAGQSCAARLLSLREDGFFKEQRTPIDIVTQLKVKGWIHTSSQVSAAAIGLFKAQKLQRTKAGAGAWLYYWDRV